MALVFAYGDLTDWKLRKQIVKRPVDSQIAILPGHEKKVVKGDYATVRIQDESTVVGIVFFLNDKELSLLDKKEVGYHRELKQLHNNQSAWVYIKGSTKKGTDNG